jgi:S1-C subfamily serine protease
MTILSEISGVFASLVEKTAQRVVAIDQGGNHAASGILWQSGLVVTASEALGDDDRFELALPDGGAATAALAGRDASTDIALLRLEGDAASVEPFTPAKAVRAGAIAAAVGRSTNGTLAASGIVKETGASWHSSLGGLIDRRIVLDLNLDRRGHGGAVVDIAGDLIGIAAFAPHHQALVIPVETIDRIAESLKSGGVSRGYLGVSLHPLRASRDRSGAIIVQIDEGGPAKRAGLFVGDVLSAWNGEAITSVRDVFRRLGPDAVGATVTLDIVRANQPLRIDVAISERPHK